MFLRSTSRRKNGKTHVYWNIVENKRLDDGRVVQRQVLYLGEINSSQMDAWRRAIEVVDESTGEARTLALFPEDRRVATTDADTVQVRLSEMRLCRPRQWGACWLTGQLGAPSHSIASGRNDCRAAGKGRGGTMCWRCWRPTG